MKNVKDQVYAALCTVSENVSDAYPRSWAEGSTLQYTEEQNDVYEASSDAEGMREDKALVRYRIDIWNNHSTWETGDMEKPGRAEDHSGCYRVNGHIQFELGR